MSRNVTGFIVFICTSTLITGSVVPSLSQVPAEEEKEGKSRKRRKFNRPPSEEKTPIYYYYSQEWSFQGIPGAGYFVAQDDDDRSAIYSTLRLLAYSLSSAIDH